VFLEEHEHIFKSTTVTENHLPVIRYHVTYLGGLWFKPRSGHRIS
jgi:hypothetical protein